jgi:Tfp pilus assembly protein PilO
VNKSVNFTLTARTVALLLLGVAVLFAGAGWFIVVSPKRTKATELASTIQSKQSQLTLAQHTPAPSPAKAAADTAAVGAALPDDVVMPQVVDQLNTLATRAGVTLDTITPQAAVTGTGYTSVPLDVVVDGRYFGVEKFLRLVRNQVKLQKTQVAAAGRLFDVQSVQLQQTEPAPTVTATLTLDAFYYSPTATQTVPTTTTSDGTDTTATSATTG